MMPTERPQSRAYLQAARQDPDTQKPASGTIARNAAKISTALSQ